MLRTPRHRPASAAPRPPSGTRGTLATRGALATRGRTRAWWAPLLVGALAAAGCAAGSDADDGDDAGSGTGAGVDAAGDPDAGGPGAGGPDGGAAAPDGGAGGPGAGRTDAGGPGAGGPGGGAAERCHPDPATPGLDGVTPARLSATGLYADIAAHTLAAGVRAFEPAYPLWSDGAEKSRWVALPPGCRIDTSDMDHWSLPVGTRLWKEFRLGGRRLETRLIVRFGPGPDDFVYGAYQWDEGETEGTLVPHGRRDVAGTRHDIPSAGDCRTCHEPLPERALGFGAVQLSHDRGGLDLATLAAEGLLTHAPDPDGYPAPGDATAAAALGTLHANCGQCHHARGVSVHTPFVLRLEVAERTVEQTGAWRTAVGAPTAVFQHAGVTHRIAPGKPAASAVTYRMGVRTAGQQMPPLGTEEVDRTGLAAVERWIQSLPAAPR